MNLDPKDRFLQTLPTQLRLWSPTALASYMACPRRYFYHYVEKWSPGEDGVEKSVDLAFGDFVHQAHDVFMKALASGSSTEEATELAVEHTLQVSWPEGEEPWGGSYLQVWRCEGKVKGAKSRPVKCPNSKQWNTFPEAWDFDTAGHLCPHCHEQLTSATVYFPHDKTKNRHTLVRSVIALCDALTQSMMRPVVLPDGRIGSELEFARELPLLSPDGTPYFMVGSFDGLAAVGDGEEWALPELKTTRKDPNEAYFRQFQPGAQLYTYSWAAYLDYPNKRPKVHIVVIQVGVGFTHVHVRPMRVPPEVLGEWETEMVSWVIRAERDAQLYKLNDPGAYPRNPTACHGLPGAPTTPCPFLGICQLAASDREPFLKSNFHRRANAIAGQVDKSIR